MATWNRKVSYDAESGSLVVTEAASGANPPPAPGKGPRNDTANDITTYEADRPAKVKYHADDSVDYLGALLAKDGEVAPSYKVRNQGKVLVVVDDCPTGDEYSYRVMGMVGTDFVYTEDPQIHNLGG